ncbi:MAG: TonB-dependent receptor [Erythrobacter sp.]|uniref:TonB-dependent receptor n=1 Tax=Erythrobacter sp. TaxID=1042 RepID=UPI0026018E03|nr:TonB-dependent receptor [Erythrobacter sp.]MDJ0977398.1 TonB-dependent receptor [Erythrobacter sp.]
MAYHSLKTSLRAALFAGVCFMVPYSALAQDYDAPDEAEGEGNTIVVTATPIADSLDAALEIKRKAPNVVDVISSDTIGRFPDQNLADALNRLPGVAVERDQGQARFVNFRGAPFRFTAIAFDGIDIPGAENGRIPRFDSFPATIVSAVEANKAITPDMPGEAVSGFINMITFDPFARDGLHVSVEGGLGVQELGDGQVERYNGRLSWSNDTIGLVVFGSHNGRDQTTDNREFDVVDGDIATVEFRNYLVERQDNAYGGRLEYRGDGALSRLFVSSIYSEFIDDELRNQYNFDLTDPVEPDAIGTDPSLGVTRLLQDGRYQNSTFTNTLGADFTSGDWLLELRGNYTETRSSVDLIIPFSTAGSAGGNFDFTDVEDPVLNLFDASSGDSISIGDVDYFFELILPVVSELDIDAYQFKADLTGDVELFGHASTLKFGAKYDTRDATGFDTVVGTAFPPAGFDYSVFDTGELWPSDFNNTINGTIFDNEGVVDALSASGVDLNAEVPADLLIGIEEDIYSAYAMLTSEFDWGSLVVGGRVEFTDFTSSGNSAFEADDGSVVISPVVASRDYVNFLPSVHANFDIDENAVFRASVSTGVNRPTYVESRASIAVDATALASGGLVNVTGGNPDLEAETAWGGDLSFEYYFDEGSLFAVAAFARFIDNVIYAEQTFFDDISVFDPNIPAGRSGNFISFANGEDGELFGVEVTFTGRASSFTDSFLGGFGIETSATVLDSRFTIPALDGRAARDLRLPGTSDFLFNGSVFFERFGLSTRLSYTYRDDWLDETESEGNDVFWNAQERLDASIRYTFTDVLGDAAVTLFADANNLTNAVDVRYTNTPRTPNQVEGYGARYLFGVRIDY